MHGSTALRQGGKEKTASGRRSARAPESAAPPAPGTRLAAAALVPILGAGSLGLWTVVPVGWLWIAASLSDNYLTIYLLALVGCPLAMSLWGWGLYRVNGAYLRLSGRGAAAERGSRVESGGTTRPLMLLDVLVTASALLALIALLVWFFVFAGSPTSTPIPDEFSGQAGAK